MLFESAIPDGDAKITNAITEKHRPHQPVERLIHIIRGQKVMLDNDLAQLYEVQTKRLNEAVSQNPARFPPTFMFRLTQDELRDLRSQSATSNKTRGGRRYLPHVFTEHGVGDAFLGSQ